MQCDFYANCGLLLRLRDASLAIDMPNGLHTLFDGLPDETLEQITAGEPPFEHLTGFLFTHRHSDHYDKKRLAGVLERRPTLQTFSPNGATPPSGELTYGPFHIRYYTVPHSGEDFSGVFHRVFLIEADGVLVYVTGDADWKPWLHLPILRDCRPDLAVWDPNILIHEESRVLLLRAEKNCINHLPLFSEDALGIGRKCRSVYARIGAEYPNTELIDRAGVSIEIKKA